MTKGEEEDTEEEELKEELVEHEEEDDHRFELLERRIAERVQRHSDRRDVVNHGGGGSGILSGRSDLEIILIVVLALVIGFVIAHIIHSLRKRPQHGGEGCPFPHWAPPFAYQHQQHQSAEEPERYHNLPILSRRRDRINPRTPESFLRNGIYLDENMEGCLLEEQTREVWQVVRNEFGKLIDAKRIDLDEDY